MGSEQPSSIEDQALNIEVYKREPSEGGIRLENDHTVTGDGVEPWRHPFVERLVIDLGPLCERTGRFRESQPPVEVR